MEKYQVYKNTFNNKTEIVDYCRNIIEKYQYKKTITNDDFNFLIELFKYHPNNESKLNNLKSISVGVGTFDTKCFYLTYTNGKVDDISWTKCINNIPFNQDKQSEFILPFGKYKGKSIYEVYENDKQYLEWLSKQDWINRRTKVFTNQILKYGYIPFNAYTLTKKRKPE